MSPTHKIISYKYPKNMSSRYMDFFKSYTNPLGKTVAETAHQSPIIGNREIPLASNIKKVNFFENKDNYARSMSSNNFNYDKIRLVI